MKNDYVLFFLGDLLVSWMKCKQGITKISEENPFAVSLLQAFNDREEMLITNPVLATAVYLDPRLHHKNSPPQLLGSFEHDIEVNILINYTSAY